jgi:hypothetical protein
MSKNDDATDFIRERKAREADEYREKIEFGTFTDDDGVLRWNMGNAVPADIYRTAYGFDMPVAMLAAYERETAKVIGRYKAAQARRSPEQIAEETAEMRAAFGPGEEVVNVITGKRTRL